MTAPTTGKKGWMLLQRKFVDAVMEESAFQQRLHGQLVNKGFSNLKLENLSEFLSAVEKFGMILKATVSITFNREERRILRLHKNTPLIEIMLFSAPTNNNTHTPEEKAVTP